MYPLCLKALRWCIQACTWHCWTRRLAATTDSRSTRTEQIHLIRRACSGSRGGWTAYTKQGATYLPMIPPAGETRCCRYTTSQRRSPPTWMWIPPETFYGAHPVSGLCDILYKPYISPLALPFGEDEDEFDFLLYLSKLMHDKNSIRSFITGMNHLQKFYS